MRFVRTDKKCLSISSVNESGKERYAQTECIVMMFFIVLSGPVLPEAEDRPESSL